MLVSVVVPVYNESDGIKLFHNDLLVPVLNADKKNSYEKNQINFLDGIIDIAKQMKNSK